MRKCLDKDTIILGPTMANVFRINNIYNYQCIIKYRKDDNLFNSLKSIDEHYKKENISKVLGSKVFVKSIGADLAVLLEHAA